MPPRSQRHCCTWPLRRPSSTRRRGFRTSTSYEDWEALWTDDAIYWVPANGANIDPEKEMSIIYDNRSRIALRVRQLLTGKRHTQTPQSRLRRMVSNIELLGETAGANLGRQQQHGVRIQPARRHASGPRATNTALRHVDGELRMAYKKVDTRQQRESALHALVPDLAGLSGFDIGTARS